MTPLTLSVLLLACTPPTTLVEGNVFATWGDDIEIPGLPGVDVVMIDADGFGELAATTTDGIGGFSVEVPQETNLFVEVVGDGLRPAWFPAVVGIEEQITVEPHTLFGVTGAEATALETLFEGCEGGGGGPGLAFGEVRSYELATVISGEHPTIANAQVTVASADGARWAACYFDPEGEIYDPEAGVTGDAGWFVVPNLPAGIHTLELTYDFGAGNLETQTYPLGIGDGVTVSPWFPAWVGLP